MTTLARLFWPALTGALAGISIVLWTRQPAPAVIEASTPPAMGTWTQAGLDEGSSSYADAVAQASPAVVNIYTQKTLNRAYHPLLRSEVYRHFFNNSDDPLQQRMQSALGSGVIISPDGYLLTNNHVIDGADEILVLLQDGRESKARLIGTDPDSDLAVLKIEMENLTAIRVGNPGSARIGDIVLAIGNPFGVGQTVTQGILSATGRYGLGINTYENYLQTDAAINPGNSGGALIDVHGNLLGINTAILDQTGSSVGIGFAIPSDMAVKAMEDLLNYGQVVRGWLGIEAQQLTPELAKAFNLGAPKGLIVTGIYRDSPAQTAGLRPGDIIQLINNTPVSDGRYSMNQIARGRPGDEVTIGIIRDGENLVLKAVLASKPQNKTN